MVLLFGIILMQLTLNVLKLENISSEIYMENDFWKIAIQVIYHQIKLHIKPRPVLTDVEFQSHRMELKQ